MALDENVLWRIDAWDPLAGRAFLCRRHPDKPETPVLDQSAIFVCPPFFGPEFVASRAPGLASTRGSFQAGLFIGREEAGFASLEDAISFIRRGYGSHGSEPFPGLPSPPLEPGPDGGASGVALEIPADQFGSTRAPGFTKIDGALLACLKMFESQSSSASLGSLALAMEWSFKDPKHLQHIRLPIQHAGYELAREIFKRMPTSGDTDELLEWLSVLRCFTSMLLRLGCSYKDVDLLFDTMLGSAPAKSKAAYPQLFDGKNSGIFGIDFPYVQPWPLWNHDQSRDIDVYDELASLPLPRSCIERFQNLDASATVLAHLSICLATPSKLAKAPHLDRSLLLFCSALVVVSTPIQIGLFSSPLHDRLRRDLRHALDVKLGNAAWAWLSNQLPDRAFPKELERVLEDAPRVWAAQDADEPLKIERLTEEAAESIHELLSEMIDTDAPDSVFLDEGNFGQSLRSQTEQEPPGYYEA